MLSNNRLIKLTFHYFYIIFDYSWFIELNLNQYMLLLFLWLFIHHFFFFGVLVVIFASLVFYCLLALIGLEFIDIETCSELWLLIDCRLYPNQTCGFASPAGLWKFMVRVSVSCSYLFISIDCISRSKISFKLFVQALFCWLFNCVYHIYCISVHQF